MIISKRTKIFETGLLCALAAFALSCTFRVGGGRGDAIESWETSNGKFKIRVTEYREKHPVYLTHFFYVFESSAVESNEWREVMSIKNDDDVPLPRKQVQFLNDQVGYAFMNEKYAVTTDSGRVWEIWEATPKNLPKLQSELGNIRNVHIESDGSGSMILNALIDGQVKSLTAYTQDYGRRWSAE